MERHPYPGLEIEDGKRQQEIEWRIQRVAWGLFTVLLVAVVLGVFGRGGPFSEVTARSDDGSVQIEYERFLRNHSPDTLKLTMRTDADTVRVRVDSQYLKRIQLEQITPQPEQVIAESEAITFIFNTRPAPGAYVVFHFSPDRVGRLTGWIAVDGRQRQTLRQFVHP